MPEDQTKEQLFRAQVDRVLHGPGHSSIEQRARAFADDVVPASGLDDDQEFELVICAALGRASRLYDAGLAALAEATQEGRSGDAS